MNPIETFVDEKPEGQSINVSSDVYIKYSTTYIEWQAFPPNIPMIHKNINLIFFHKESKILLL